MKKFINIIKKKWLRDTAKTTLLVAILIAIFVGINYGVQKLDLKDIDVTKDKVNSISDQSIEQLKKVDKNVNIYFFGYEEESTGVKLAKQYKQANDKISYEVIERGSRQDLESKYGITEDTTVIIIEVGEKSKILTSDELYTYDYSTYEQIDLTEQKITNSIMILVSDVNPKVYFLTGHNEYSLENHMTILSAYIKNEVNDIETLNLVAKGEIPADCSVLAIMTPDEDFTDMEVTKITEYINKGGKILWFSEPELNGKKYPNIQKILDLYGVTLAEGIVKETDSDKLVSGSTNFVIPNINSSNKITEEISKSGMVILLNPGKIDFADDNKLEELGVEVNNILTSSEKAFFRKDMSIKSTTATDSEETGTFTIASQVDKKINEDTTSSMIICASNLFITDYNNVPIGTQNVPMVYLYNNSDIVLNSIAYLSKREDAITIRKNTNVVTYTATEQQNNIIQAIIFGIPVLIVAIGVVVSRMRKRRK